MGVWIEMLWILRYLLWILVTPCVGVWIEIKKTHDSNDGTLVTPCVGVWIEIPPDVVWSTLP